MFGGKHDLLFRRFAANMGWGGSVYRPQIIASRRKRVSRHVHNPDPDPRRGIPRGRRFFKGR
jgi:hypothetical protein